MGCSAFFLVLFLSLIWGFPGFIIGIIIVFLYNTFLKNNIKQTPYSQDTLFAFMDNIIMIFSHIVLDDNIVTKEEVNFVKQQFLLMFPNNTTFTNRLMEQFKFYNEHPETIDISIAINNLRSLSHNEKISIFSILINLSKFSGGDALKERIYSIGSNLGIDIYEIDSMWSFYYAENTNSTSQAYYYNVLGLDVNATHTDVKNRYKELAKKYHPDKLHNMPESFRKDAEEKLKEINRAYSEIMK